MTEEKEVASTAEMEKVKIIVEIPQLPLSYSGEVDLPPDLKRGKRRRKTKPPANSA